MLCLPGVVMDVTLRELVSFVSELLSAAKQLKRAEVQAPVASMRKDESILLLRFVAACRAQTHDVSTECSLAKSGVVVISVISRRIF